ncbi:MAG TPA: radical SAM protein [Anaerolineae bacterium]|nr:radical SAM protein [Anaerolineae bacterium]
MLFSGTLGPTLLTGSLKTGSLAVMFDNVESLTCDRAGRLWSRWTGGHTFRRGLDGRVLEKWQENGHRKRRWLLEVQAAPLLDESAARMRSLGESIAAGRVKWIIAPEGDELAGVIERAAQFDARAAEHDRERFDAVYDRIGILPPDQYLSLVLQATTGCSFNTCTFCDFYAAQRFRIKSDRAFRAHVRAVLAYMGESIRMRRSIFLGEANALTIPFNRLVSLMTIVREEIGDHSPRSEGEWGWPVYAFLDAFSGTQKSVDEYRRLAALGLKRVSIGLESGHDPLLDFVRKPGAAQDAVETVSALKMAGIAVSLIVLIGLGGNRYAEPHVSDTVAVLNAMPLGKGDILYFSDLVEHESTPYPALSRAAGIRPLTADETSRQRQAIRSALRFGRGGPIVSKYDIREFVY